MAMDNFHTTLFLSGQIWSKCQNKFGRAKPGLYFCPVKYGQNVQTNLARPGPALPGLTKGLRMRGGADLYEHRLFIEKRFFSLILVNFGPSRTQKWIRLEILR